ncbi:hypothetical protein [Chitinophaga sp. CF418]|uniref:hypothetical protein n=1 Tax=Chitinophaga sp. CF418 TaxID=1855287 RepID=UPI00091D37B0|nr:hypothetical protein [Chitinophaga sp. CF418]SHN44435.1 hypothetical protein SAMN05216311_11783 [Chitinophaga sp. CF418]
MTKESNRQTVKTLHYFSGITLSLFIGIHLLNHLFSFAGPEAHIALMERFRKVYRHPVIETILLLVVLVQVVSGIRLLFNRNAKTLAEKIQIYSGLYLSIFLIGHVGAVIASRQLEHLDTNFYYTVAGFNMHPATFFFIPYYFLDVCAISLHIASIHYLKTRSKGGAYLIGGTGILVAMLIILGYTNCFQWRETPPKERAFIEKYFGKGY